MPRSRLPSGPLRPSDPFRARTRIPPGGWSSATLVVGHVPTPGTASSPPPAATEISSAAGAAPSGYPTAATTSPPQRIAATSASSASAARSTAASAAEASVSDDETAARNSASCWVDQTGGGISGDRQNDQGLVVEATHPPRAGDLPVGIEACHRRSGTVCREPVDLGPDPPVPEHAASPDAVEGEHAERRVTLEGSERVAPGGVGFP